ncbi:hypothetical protein [Acaryochloris sp. CCMEE 5410]|uniref:hypothetical protein n=1 Tax=Acaryochloris sp. CCMEE 5410 TaxID=310037 RepID=UPI0002E28B20|nr:hypothetical protein [Acaryochloris sp. CCMEE 5410]KAI9134263.1 hypothetical protein ON05_013885 [Acaryochloris sp. CCMEE 5410]
MSSTISIKTFALWFGLYAIGSFIIHNLLAFTIPVAIAFFMLVLPVYGVGLLYLIFRAIKHPHGQLRYRELWLWVGLTCQCLVLLASPRNCYGFKQGADCTPPVAGFAVVVGLYLISLVVFFINLRIEPAKTQG